MAESKIFRLSEGLDAEKVGRGIENFLRNKKKMLVEGTTTPEGFFIQAKEESGWKKIAGMDMATQVQVMQMDSMISVEVGSGKWADKLGAGAVGMVLFAPLAATAAYGAVMQKKLPSEIFAFVEEFIMSGGQNVVVSMSINKDDASKIVCPNCHASVDKGMKFCNSCGERLSIECPSCHAAVGLGTKFCPECGSPMEVKQYCPNCNKEIEPGVKFCSECGTRLE